jgi:methionyl-tRNA formyltransferase
LTDAAGTTARLVFAGTPEFAAVALDALIGAGHEVALALTQPDRPAGRGMKLTPSDVKRRALEHAIPVCQPTSLRDPAALGPLREVNADAMIVAAYGLILPPSVLEIFPHGCVNIHASLLPRWRGAAPIQRALLAGDEETGICIMAMDAGLDTGPVYLRESLAIEPQETAGSLHDRLAILGGRCIVTALPGILSGSLVPETQSEAGATYARKIAKEEAAINWSSSAIDVDRQIRAFNPFPGAFTRVGGAQVKIWAAEPISAGADGRAGEVLNADADGIVVRCGVGAIRLHQLQMAGGKRMDAVQFLRGHGLPPGSLFGI